LLFDKQGPVLEIGSGGGFLAAFIPDLLTSDIHFMEHTRITLDGCRLPFKADALSAIVMVNVFHHLPDVLGFLADAARCVRGGGKIIMIEPWMTPWSRFVYTYFHHEDCDPRTEKLQLDYGKPLSAANAALPWIVFKRDRAFFQSKFSKWRIASIAPEMPFSYLLSGGFSLKSLLPPNVLFLILKLEKSLEPRLANLAMFAGIVLVKKRV
jgi:SAM-dependent methyltransferase